MMVDEVECVKEEGWQLHLPGAGSCRWSQLPDPKVAQMNLGTSFVKRRWGSTHLIIFFR